MDSSYPGKSLELFKKPHHKIKKKAFYENGIHSSVEYSDCFSYRYSLTRCWNIKNPRLMLVLFNPSTANEKFDDPTTTRCIKRSALLGFGSIKICNLFSIISRSPKFVLSSTKPIGIYTDSVIEDSCRWLKQGPSNPILICGWGSNGVFRDRANEVKEILSQHVSELYCLGITKNCQPRHPLYIRYTEKVRKWL